MALIECPECGRQVSDRAASCPQCGCPIAPAQGAAVRARTEGSQGAERTLVSVRPAMFRSRPGAFILCVILIAAGVGLIILLIWWLHCLNSRLIVTDSRTVLRRGVLSKKTVEVRHRDVRAINVHQTMFQRLFGVGSIGVGTAAQAGMEIEIDGIPTPQEIAAVIRRMQR